MRYVNVADEPKIIVSSMSSVWVKPGEEVHMSPKDIKHAGANMRFFHSVVEYIVPTPIVNEKKAKNEDFENTTPASNPIPEIKEKVVEVKKDDNKEVEKTQEKDKSKPLDKEEINEDIKSGTEKVEEDSREAVKVTAGN